jgi:hypothetical protein
MTGDVRHRKHLKVAGSTVEKMTASGDHFATITNLYELLSFFQLRFLHLSNADITETTA